MSGLQLNVSPRALLLSVGGAAGVQAVRSLAEANRDRMDAYEDAQGAGRIAFDTWAALSAVVPSLAGQTAEVFNDAGNNHTDPVVGGTVPNEGIYRYSAAAPVGWQRLTDLGTSDQALQFSTITAAGAASISADRQSVLLAASATMANYGGGQYVRAANQPAHNGKFQDANGDWWELNEPRVRPEQFFRIPMASWRPAINDAVTYLRTKFGRGEVEFGPFAYDVDGPTYLYSHISFRGQGKAVSVIRAKGGSAWTAGAAVVQSYGFAKGLNLFNMSNPLVAGDARMTIDVHVTDLCIDGNCDGHSGGAGVANAGGLFLYGKNWVLSNLLVFATASHGIWTECGAYVNDYTGTFQSYTDNLPECISTNIHINRAGKHGWYYRGGGDSKIGTAIIADSIWAAFYQEQDATCASEGLIFDAIHGYGSMGEDAVGIADMNTEEPGGSSPGGYEIRLCGASGNYLYTDSPLRGGIRIEGVVAVQTIQALNCQRAKRSTKYHDIYTQSGQLHADLILSAILAFDTTPVNGAGSWYPTNTVSAVGTPVYWGANTSDSSVQHIKHYRSGAGPTVPGFTFLKNDGKSLTINGGLISAGLGVIGARMSGQSNKISLTFYQCATGLSIVTAGGGNSQMDCSFGGCTTDYVLDGSKPLGDIYRFRRSSGYSEQFGDKASFTASGGVTALSSYGGNAPSGAFTTDITTANQTTRSLTAFSNARVAGARTYGPFFVSQDLLGAASATYSHYVGGEVNVWLPNAGANADAYLWVQGFKAAAGVWSGAGNRVEHSDFANFPGTLAAAYATTDGISRVFADVGGEVVSNNISAGSNLTGYSQRINFSGVLNGVRSGAAYVQGSAYGELFLQSAGVGSDVVIGPGKTRFVSSHYTQDGAGTVFAEAGATLAATGTNVAYSQRINFYGVNAGVRSVPAYVCSSPYGELFLQSKDANTDVVLGPGPVRTVGRIHQDDGSVTFADVGAAVVTGSGLTGDGAKINFYGVLAGVKSAAAYIQGAAYGDLYLAASAAGRDIAVTVGGLRMVAGKIWSVDGFAGNFAEVGSVVAATGANAGVSQKLAFFGVTAGARSSPATINASAGGDLLLQAAAGKEVQIGPYRTRVAARLYLPDGGDTIAFDVGTTATTGTNYSARIQFWGNQGGVRNSTAPYIQSSPYGEMFLQSGGTTMDCVIGPGKTRFGGLLYIPDGGATTMQALYGSVALGTGLTGPSQKIDFYGVTAGVRAANASIYADAVGNLTVAPVAGKNLVSTTGVEIGGAAGPTWTSATGAPATSQPNGSIYSRTDGVTGSRMYLSAGGGVWNAVAGV